MGLTHTVLERTGLSPVPWANFGPLSAFGADRTRPAGQPILVLSHPRSGSSWVGTTLGRSSGALYLHEPLTLPYLREHPGSPVFEFPIDAPPEAYRHSMAALASAWPRFPPGIVRFPGQWRLAERRDRRLVVKEVNPLAVRWIADALQPRIVYLIRHPAGVAASFAALGWTRGLGPAGFARRFSVRIGAGRLDPKAHLGSSWKELGAVQALVHVAVAAELRTLPSVLIVRYEDLCCDPAAAFRHMFDFADLPWSPSLERTIARESSAESQQRDDVYGTMRNSRKMAQAWRSELGPDAIDEIRDGYVSAGAPFYPPDEW